MGDYGGGGYTPAGGVSGGNATVPNDAPIQPPQAFVDMFSRQISNGYGGLNYSNLGITHLTEIGSYVIAYEARYAHNLNGDSYPNLAGNALDADSVNEVLSYMVAQFPEAVSGELILTLTGGTNAAPTGQGLINKATLISNGWTVTTN